MPGRESNAEAPTFEDPFEGESVEERVYGTVIAIREPTTAATIAGRADCDPKSARKYLEWFAELGVVTRHEGEPRTYERNDAYLEWRRVHQLASGHSREELEARVRELTAKIDDYERVYGQRTPAEVDAIAATDAAEDRSIDDIYADLGDWESARRARERLERARQQRVGSERDPASP